MRKSVLSSLSLVLGAWLLVPGFIPFARGTRHYGLGTAASAALTIDKPFWGFANHPTAHALTPEKVFGSGVETRTRITKDTDLSFWGTYTAVGERCGLLDSQDSNWNDGGMFPNSLLREDWGAADSFKYGLSVQSGRVSFEPVTSRIFTPRWRADARSDVLVNVYLADGWSWAKNVFWTRFAGWALPGVDRMPEFDWTSNPHETIAASSNRWACFSCFPPDGVLRFDEPGVPDQIADALNYNAFENAALWVNPCNDGGMYGLLAWPFPTNTLISALAAYIDGVYGQDPSNRWTAARTANALTNGTTRIAAAPWVALNNAIGWADILYGRAEDGVVSTEEDKGYYRSYTVPAATDCKLKQTGENAYRFTCELSWEDTQTELQTSAVYSVNRPDTVYTAYREWNNNKGIKLWMDGDPIVITSDDVAAIVEEWTQIVASYGSDWQPVDGDWIRMDVSADGLGIAARFALMNGTEEYGWPHTFETNFTVSVLSAVTNVNAHGHASKTARRLRVGDFHPNMNDLFGSQWIPVESNAWQKGRLRRVTDTHAFDTKLVFASGTADPFGSRSENADRRDFPANEWGSIPSGCQWWMRAEALGEAGSRYGLLARLSNRQAANSAATLQETAALLAPFGADPRTDDRIAVVDGRELDDIRAVHEIVFDLDAEANLFCGGASWVPGADGRWHAVKDEVDMPGFHTVTNIIGRQTVTHTQQVISDNPADWNWITFTPPPSTEHSTGFYEDSFVTNNVAPPVTNHLSYTVGGRQFEDTVITPGETVEYEKLFLRDAAQDNWVWTNRSYTLDFPTVIEKEFTDVFPAETNIYTLASNAFYHVEVSFDPVTVTNSVPTVTNTFNTVTNCVEVYTETIEPYTVDYLEPYTVHYTENREFTVSVDGEVYTVTQPITAASNAWRTVTLEVPGYEYVSTNCWLGLTTTNIVTEGTEWTYTRPKAKFRTVYHNVSDKFTDAVNVGGFSKIFETNFPWRVEAAPARGVAIRSSYPCRYQWKFRNLHSPAEVYPTGPFN